MGYAILSDAKAMLGLTVTTDDARLERINNALSLRFEQETGRRFGTGATVDTVTVIPRGGATLVLPRPVRTITSITVGGTWNGTVWTGGTALTVDQWLRNPEMTNAAGESWGIVGSFPWASPVVITGTWANTDGDAAVPSDVVYAITFSVARQYRAEKAGNDGDVGPDGFALTVPRAVPNPVWDAAVAAHASLVALVV